MSGPDNQWRERCDMYFSKMDNFKNKGGVADKHVMEQGDYRLDKPHDVTFYKKKQPPKGLIRWLGSLNLHGTSMLLRAKSYLFCFIWVFITIVACVAFALGSYLLIKDYRDEDYIMKTNTINDGPNASPLSLMVCNSNIIRKSKIASGTRFHGLKNLNLTHFQLLGIINNNQGKTINDLLTGTNLLSFLRERDMLDKASSILTDVNEEYASYSAMLTDSDWDNVGHSSLSVEFVTFGRAFRMTSSELREFGHDIEADIIGCSKNERPCDSSEISSIQNVHLGNCAMIYLSLKDSWFDTLTLTLNAQSEDYLDLISPPPGVRVFVVQSSSFTSSSWPVDSHEAQVANTGKGLHLSISKSHEIRRKSENCQKDPNYSRIQCQSRCLELYTADLCKCSVSLQSPLPQRCRVHVQYEFVCQRLLQELFKRNQLPCKCQQVCKEEIVTVSTSTFDWVNGNEEDRLLASMMASGMSNNISKLRDSVTKISVSWSYSPFVRLQEDDKMTLTDLILRLGALSAITVGVSIVTVVELLWLLGRAFLFLCSAVTKTHEHRDNVVHRIHKQEPYPEFDNINQTHGHQEQQHPDINNTEHSWYVYRQNGNGGQDPPTSVQKDFQLAASPLNKRTINNYIFQTPHHTQLYQPPSQGHAEFLYRGLPRESGVVYDQTADHQASPIKDRGDSFDNHRVVYKKEDELFNRPWQRSGHMGVYPRVHIPNPNSRGNKEVPLFNSPFMTLAEDGAPTTDNNIDVDVGDENEGNTFNHIAKYIQNSSNSKSTSEIHNRKDGQGYFGLLYQTSSNSGTGVRNDSETRANDNGNIFKISDADHIDNTRSWNSKTDSSTRRNGPDLSGLYGLQPDNSTSRRSQRQYNSESRNSVRGFGRTPKK